MARPLALLLRFAIAVAAAAATALWSACLADESPAGPAAARVEIASAPTTVTAGDFVALSATVYDGAGRALSNAQVRWQTSDPAVAQVTERGLVMVTGAGEVAITARAAGAMQRVQLQAREREIAPGELAFTFGPEETVFDYRVDRCANSDTIDTHAHAVRLADDSLLLVAGNQPRNYVSAGPDFAHLRRRCGQPALVSQGDATPQSFRNGEWLAAVYREGEHLHALVHNEYHDPVSQGCAIGNPNPGNPCWYNSITAMRSTDGGRSFAPAGAGNLLVAPAPQRWDPADPAARKQPQGYFGVSNIVSRGDGYYYAVFFAIPRPATPQVRGLCVMRTATLADPASWRAWDGHAFALAMKNPYDSAQPVPSCAIVLRSDAKGSLTYNSYLQRFMLVDAIFARAPGGGGVECGLYYSLSKDLVTWSPTRRFKAVALPMWSRPCRAPGGGGVAYPSIIDHASDSVNFDRAGQVPFLYFVRWTTGTSAFPRQLVRQPMILLKSPSFGG